MKMVKKTESSNGVNKDVALKSELGIFGGMAIIAGVMIGSGIFVSPKGVLRGAGSVGLTLIIWTLGGLISLCGALSYAELGTMIPKSGGDYIYLLETVHPVLAFLRIFISMVLLSPASIAIMTLTFAQYFLGLVFPDDCGAPPESIKKLVAISVISPPVLSVLLVLLVAVNIYSVKLANRLQIVFTSAKLLALVCIVLGGMVKLAQGHTENLNSGFEGTETNAGNMALAFYSSMWAYDGWNQLNTSTEELEKPSKNLPRAIFISVPVVTVIYILTNISYFTVLSKPALLESEAVAWSWAELAMPGFAFMIPVFVCVSTFGSANGSLFGFGRIAYVGAREGHMMRLLSCIQVHRLTPTPALLFGGFISIFMVIPSDIGSLIDFYSFAGWIFSAILFGILIILRFTKPALHRPYKVPLVFPVIALLASVFLVVAPIVQSPQIEFLYAFLFILGGLLFYIPFVHCQISLPGIGWLETVSMMLLRVVRPTGNGITRADVSQLLSNKL